MQAELTAGQKQTHWMWFIFPQISVLGASGMAQRFAISGLDEARAYLVASACWALACVHALR